MKSAKTVVNKGTRQRDDAQKESRDQAEERDDQAYVNFVTRLNKVSDREIEDALIERSAQLSLR